MQSPLIAINAGLLTFPQAVGVVFGASLGTTGTGWIGIFNRSHYEEVLIARVLPQVLAKQRLPKEQVNPKTFWRERFQARFKSSKEYHS